MLSISQRAVTTVGLVYVLVIIAALVAANIAVAARKGRPRIALLVELLIYTAWAGFAIYAGVRTSAFPSALAILIIVLVAALVSRLTVGKRLSRMLGLEDALNRSTFGQRFNARVEAAKSRMVERERKAEQLGISVADVLELEHAEQKRNAK